MRESLIGALGEPLIEYLRDAEDAARGCRGVCVEQYEAVARPEDRVNLHIRLRVVRGICWKSAKPSVSKPTAS